jgi:phosphoglycerate dehydrogenase-like enzyme
LPGLGVSAGSKSTKAQAPHAARAARPRDDPARRVERLVLSPHRAGAMVDSLYEIGRQTVADAELVLKGLPQLSCRRAQRETVARSRSKPIERS